MSKDMLKGIHRRHLGVTHDEEVIAPKGYVAGGDGKPAIRYPSPEYVAIFEDFQFSPGAGLGAGSDTGTTPIAIGVNDTGLAGLNFITRKGDVAIAGAIVAGANGVFRFTHANVSTDTVAGSSAGFVQPTLNWKVNQGRGAGAGSLRFGVRLKRSIYTGGEHGLFVGFTDTTAHEFPVYDTGGTADKANASNAFGIGWNVSGANTGWVGFAVDGNVVQELSLDPTTPTANKYVTLEMEAHRSVTDTGGRVDYWIDGVKKGTIANPCNVSTALTPCCYSYDTGAAASMDYDWVAVSAPRDTGL
jgi:hypothetical protein